VPEGIEQTDRKKQKKRFRIGDRKKEACRPANEEKQSQPGTPLAGFFPAELIKNKKADQGQKIGEQHSYEKRLSCEHPTAAQERRPKRVEGIPFISRLIPIPGYIHVVMDIGIAQKFMVKLPVALSAVRKFYQTQVKGQPRIQSHYGGDDEDPHQH